MDDLIAFVKARLDEDEAAAKAADPGPWEVGGGAPDGMVFVREVGDLIDTVGITYRDPVFVSQVPNKTRFRENAAHIARHDPARVLREVAGKRAILAGHGADPGFGCSVCITGRGTWKEDWPNDKWPCRTVRRLAVAWDDHPDYRDEWTP